MLSILTSSLWKKPLNYFPIPIRFLCYSNTSIELLLFLLLLTIGTVVFVCISLWLKEVDLTCWLELIDSYPSTVRTRTILKPIKTLLTILSIWFHPWSLCWLALSSSLFILPMPLSLMPTMTATTHYWVVFSSVFIHSILTASQRWWRTRNCGPPWPSNTPMSFKRQYPV